MRNDDWMRWMKMGDDDLESAKINLENGKYYVCSYLCHQAVEKALKAIYIKNSGEFVRTHDLFFLAKKIGLPEELLALCKKLYSIFTETKYGIDTGSVPSEIFSKEDSEKHLKYANEVLEWARKNI